MNHEAKNLKKFSELASEEIVDAVEKSVAVAQRIANSLTWRGRYGGNLPNGKDVRDIVHDVLEGILSGKNDWVDDVNFETFLIQTVKGYISNLVRGKENQTTSAIEDMTDDDRDIIPSSASSPIDYLSEVDSENLLLEIIEAIADNSQEAKIIEAILEGCLKRREIIAHSELTSKEYDNTLKRLRRFLSSEEWQKKLTLHHK